METAEPTARFEVIFDAAGRNASKFRNEITVHKRKHRLKAGEDRVEAD